MESNFKVYMSYNICIRTLAPLVYISAVESVSMYRYALESRLLFDAQNVVNYFAIFRLRCDDTDFLRTGQRSQA